MSESADTLYTEGGVKITIFLKERRRVETFATDRFQFNVYEIKVFLMCIFLFEYYNVAYKET